MGLKNNLSIDLVNKILKCLDENPSIHKEILKEIDLKKKTSIFKMEEKEIFSKELQK